MCYELREQQQVSNHPAPSDGSGNVGLGLALDGERGKGARDRELVTVLTEGNVLMMKDRQQ